MQESLLCKSIWEQEGLFPICITHPWKLILGCFPPFLQIVVALHFSCVHGVHLFRRRWSGMSLTYSHVAVPNCQQQISVLLSSFLWGQVGPYSSATLLQQMLWTYVVLLSEPVLKALGSFGDSITTL